MFCEKCGAQLPDTAGFCNKCGNALRKNINTAAPMMKAPNAAIDRKKPFTVSKKNDKGLPKVLKGVLLLVVLMVIIAVAIVILSKDGKNLRIAEKKASIYGTWTDANKTITLTLKEDGNLLISREGATTGTGFQFTEEKGVLHVKTVGLSDLDLEYDIVDDTLHIIIAGQSMTLYRAGSSDVITSGTKNADAGAGSVGEELGDWAEDALDAVQIYVLYGTWTDSYGAISFTFSKDGRLQISGLEDTLAVDAFTFSEVDNDTLQLKAESDNPIIGAVGLNMDYEIEGDSMTVTIMGKELKLVKKN